MTSDLLGWRSLVVGASAVTRFPIMPQSGFDLQLRRRRGDIVVVEAACCVPPPPPPLFHCFSLPLVFPVTRAAGAPICPKMLVFHDSRLKYRPWRLSRAPNGGPGGQNKLKPSNSCPAISAKEVWNNLFLTALFLPLEEKPPRPLASKLKSVNDQRHERGSYIEAVVGQRRRHLRPFKRGIRRPCPRRTITALSGRPAPACEF